MAGVEVEVVMEAVTVVMEDTEGEVRCSGEEGEVEAPFHLIDGDADHVPVFMSSLKYRQCSLKLVLYLFQY